MNNLLIRADATTQMGTGHVMRCLALAQGWQDHGGRAVFLSLGESDSLKQRILHEGFDFIPLESKYNNGSDIEETLRTLEQLKMSSAKCKTWIAMDGYHFDAQYQKIIKEAGYKLLWIDDYGHADHYYADIVLNQNIYANHDLYVNREAYTRLCLGSRYVLLRREFHTWQGWTRQILPAAYKILVTMGGSDPYGTTLKVVQALKKIERQDMEATIIIGPANPHRRKIEEEISNVSFSVHILSSVQDMPEQMAWADIAITAGGTTCWELAFMGLPSVIIISSDNQQPIAEGLDSAGTSINIGWQQEAAPNKIAETIQKLLLNAKARKEMCEVGRRMVDGFGLKRLISVCENLI